jgi:hypothetical protein
VLRLAAGHAQLGDGFLKYSAARPNVSVWPISAGERS